MPKLAVAALAMTLALAASQPARAQGSMGGPPAGPPMGSTEGPMGPGMRGHGGMMGPGMWGMPGMRGMPWMTNPASPAERPLITIMLHHRSEIGLTPEQVTQLEGLRDAFAREAIRRDADIRIAELDLQGLLAADPMDLAKVEAKIREVAQMRADLRVARLKTLEQGRAVLTPEQKTRLQEFLSGGMGRAPHRAARGGVRL